MNRKKNRWFLEATLAVLVTVGVMAFFVTILDAKGSSGSSSGRSFSSSSSSSWSGRSGGSTTFKATTTHTTTSGYSKPGGTTTPAAAPGSGYTKPGGTTTPVTAAPGSGYSKPGQTPGTGAATATGPPKTSSGYGKPGEKTVAATTTTTSKFTATSTFDKKGIQAGQKERSAASLQSYKANQEKFKQPETKVDPKVAASSPVVQNIKITRVSYNDYYSRRDGYWGSYYRPAPYVYYGPPAFGVWDAMALYGTLSLINSANHTQQMQSARFAYNHADDPGYQQWRREAEKQAQSNEDLKKQLADLDKQVAVLKEKGEKKDPKYIPEGMPPEAIVAASAVAAKAPEKLVIKVATGQPGGIYAKFGEELRQAAKGQNVEVKLITTAGSMENLKLLTSGEADLALIQSDVLAKIPHNKLTEQAVLYDEYVQLLANSKAGASSVRKLDPAKDVVYIGPKGSGTSMAWEGFCEQEPWYQKIQVKNAPYSAALSEVQNNPHAYMLFVGGLNSELLKTAEEFAKKTGKLKLLPVDDKKFDDKLDLHGNPIYGSASIPSKTYPSLQAGWFWSHSVDTLSVKAVMALSTHWVDENGPDGLDALSIAIAEVQPAILRLVNK
jgi:TRAP transporter TAXI family solute receptor